MLAGLVGILSCSQTGETGNGGDSPINTPLTGGAGGSPGLSSGGSGGSGASSGGTPSSGGAGTGGTGGASPYPQCFAGDAMPENPGLVIDPAVTGVTTVLSDNNYVAMLLGPDRPACITDELAYSRLQDLEDGLRDVVETVGFPAFPEWENGHYLNWVVLNTGIPGATLPQNGGHQGNRWGHMNFESTPHNPCEWSEYEAGGALHECVHALQAELWVYNNQASGWLHEAHNNYMLTQRQALVHDNHTMGWSAHYVLQIPHIPIESMGMFTDDYVAGPADQGANGRTYVSSQVRYGLEIFFLSLSQSFGRGFVNCLWTMPESGNDRSLFQVMQEVGGVETNGIAVREFAAKTALLDFGDWTETMRNLMQQRWDNNLWFYMFPGGDGTTTFRPPEKTTPHHQGRNVIPIALDPGSTSVTVEFTPDAMGDDGTPAEFQAQLVYRNDADEPVYGPVFTSGQHTLTIEGGARGELVNFIVAVTHPNAASGSDDNSNKGFNAQEHFSYQARIVSGGKVAPPSTRPW